MTGCAALQTEAAPPKRGEKGIRWKATSIRNELGIQYKTGGAWCLYQKYADQGYTRTDTYHYRDSVADDHANVHTKWTQKGRPFLYDALKTAGVLPRME